MDTLEIQLMEAVRGYKIDVVQSLIDKGCKMDFGDEDNLRPLHLAAMNGFPEITQLLMEKGANVNCKTTEEMTPLHYAADNGFVEIAELLINRGASVDPLDKNKRTPLMFAANHGHLDIVDFLIRSGAVVNIEDIPEDGRLCVAVCKNYEHVVSALLRAGVKQAEDQFFLHYAVCHYQFVIAKLLLEHGANPDEWNEHRDTPLILALDAGNIELIKLILQYGANPNLANDLANETPLYIAISYHMLHSFDDILEVLCLHNVDLDDREGYPLRSAINQTEFSKAASLIRAGADVNKMSAMDVFVSTGDYMIKYEESLIYLMVAAGYDLWKDYFDFFKILTPARKNSATKTLFEWLTDMKFNPRRLTDLCRLKIRSHVGNKILHLVPTLDIPTSVKDFLLFEGIYINKELPKLVG